MVFLCGVVYPISAMPQILQTIAYLMPLTYTIDGLRRAFTLSQDMTVLIDASVLVVFFTVFIFPAIKLLDRRFE
jgi:ABC-2 type transport system permease protein